MIEFNEHSFARWDSETHCWAVDPGQCQLVVAASSTDLRSELAIEI
ncbi:MAG: hypothetical protein OXG34_06860 [bacterium]|nr:hypothetical protein [bacterium]MCY3890978.1 hypothetical protein [bacterium]MCY3961373.1 hypothetical protein [bacterium]MCY4133866.1 hypothetical protein [bacterium]